MNTAVARARSFPMIIESDLLGSLEVATEDVIHFDDGLLGFPECREFVLLPAARDGLYWLQSVEQTPLVFLLADPFLFCAGYSVELEPAECSDLEAAEASDVAILSIVTLPRPGETLATTNLQGPLAINLARGRARQIVLPDSTYGVRSAIDLGRTAG
jgi:flagellar assembly factor FliW